MPLDILKWLIFRRLIIMTVMERLANSIVVPVVVLDKVEDDNGDDDGVCESFHYSHDD